MAKKIKETELTEVEFDYVAEDYVVEEAVVETAPQAPEDFLAEKVHSLRERGLDNNRIAAILMIGRHIIDQIK